MFFCCFFKQNFNYLGTLLRKSMEETIEFLQIELEKDFGYHDDSAIQALQQSIQDLK